MSSRARDRGRTQVCGNREAQAKLRRAEQFMEVATLIKDEPDPDWASAAAALAVLAGIAASDAACCKALGRRSRGQDHHDAEALLEQIEPGGKNAANAMRRLINLKDEAHYGFYYMAAQDLKSAFHPGREAHSLRPSRPRTPVAEPRRSADPPKPLDRSA